MKIDALAPAQVSLLLPTLSFILGVILLIPGFIFLNPKLGKKQAIGFITAGLGLVFFTVGLIPIVKFLANGNDADAYSEMLKKDYGIRLEDNSQLSRALGSMGPGDVSSVAQVVIAADCEVGERVGTYDLIITRTNDEFRLYDTEGNPFSPCAFTVKPLIKKFGS